MQKTTPPELVQALLDAGADINARSKRGGTPLMGAVYRDNEPVVRLLLERRADDTLRDNKGRIALDIARAEGAKRCAAVLARYETAAPARR